MDESHKHCRAKGPDGKEHVTCGFIYIKSKKRQNEYKVLEVRVVGPRGTRKAPGRLVMFGFFIWVLVI